MASIHYIKYKHQYNCARPSVAPILLWINGMINERSKALYFSMCLWAQLEISSLPDSLNTKSRIEFGQNHSGFFFLILNLNCFLKVLLGLIRTKQEQLHLQLSLNWNWPKQILLRLPSSQMRFCMYWHPMSIAWPIPVVRFVLNRFYLLLLQSVSIAWVWCPA